jgi:transcription antitermination factor NusG
MSENSWFALRAFKGKAFKLKSEFEKKGWKTYMALRSEDHVEDGHHVRKDVQIVPQLLFVRCPAKELETFKNDHNDSFMIYRHFVYGEDGSKHLEMAPISEKEMEVFILVTSTNEGRDASYFGEKLPEFSEGELVRVVDGIYKGATGIVRRIKRDRKLLVAIEGVAVIAISHIPMQYLEKIN